MPRIASCFIEPCMYEYRQEELLDAAKTLFNGSTNFVRYESIFRSTGIRTRRFAAPVERIVQKESWLSRSHIFADEGTRLGEAALIGALEAVGLSPEDLGHLFFISTSGITAPSLDARILGHPPWSPATLRTPMWGLGCAGGVSGLARAADWVSSHPDKAAAVLSVEFLSLTFLPEDHSLSNFVAASLFADGVACALVAGDELADRKALQGLKIEGHRVHLFQDTLHVMGWNPVESGLQVVFSKRIPAHVREHARSEFSNLAESANVDPERITLFLGHPGGPKVLRAYEEALGWPEERFRFAWSTFADWGNMSSASVFHVLGAAFNGGWDSLLSDGEYALISALGPGFTSEQLLAR